MVAKTKYSVKSVVAPSIKSTTLTLMNKIGRIIESQSEVDLCSRQKNMSAAAELQIWSFNPEADSLVRLRLCSGDLHQNQGSNLRSLGGFIFG